MREAPACQGPGLAAVAELVDAPALTSPGCIAPCRFESCPPHISPERRYQNMICFLDHLPLSPFCARSALTRRSTKSSSSSGVRSRGIWGIGSFLVVIF